MQKILTRDVLKEINVFGVLTNYTVCRCVKKKHNFAPNFICNALLLNAVLDNVIFRHPSLFFPHVYIPLCENSCMENT